MTKSNGAAPVKIILNPIHLQAGTRIGAQGFNLPARQSVAVNVAGLNNVVDGHDVWMAPIYATEPSQFAAGNNVASFLFAEHFGHRKLIAATNVPVGTAQQISENGIGSCE